MTQERQGIRQVLSKGAKMAKRLATEEEACLFWLEKPNKISGLKAIYG